MKRKSGYPLWLRCWHWVNASLFVILLITGISMHYSEPDAPLFAFRADVLIHNASGILLTLFYGLFLFGNLMLGNGRYYKVAAGDIEPGLIRQARYYLWGIFVGEPHPYPHSDERKFNPLQKLFYLVVMFGLIPVLAVTGWALLFPERLPAEALGVPGIGLWALVHTYTGFGLSLFMVIHVYLGTTGATLGELFGFMWFGEPKDSQAAPPVPAPSIVDSAEPAADSAPSSEASEHVEVGAAKEQV